MANIVARPIVPADPSPLRHYRPKSGYRLVYPTGRAGRYAAQIEVGGVARYLGEDKNPRTAASYAAGYLKALYGPDWPAVHRAAVCATAFLTKRRLASPTAGNPVVAYSRTRRVWVLVVDLGPAPIVLTPPGQAGFPSHTAAREFYDRWAAAGKSRVQTLGAAAG